MSPVTTKPIIAMATDPIYVGTGGFTIGRVDNTIVRDPITRIPKIPGSSMAGTWRYYVALELVSRIKEKQPKFEDIKKESGNTIEEKLQKYTWNDKPSGWQGYCGNLIAKISCAGQDETSQANIENAPFEKNKENKSGHCGHCIVCKAFGFSKKDLSNQGMLFFSDLNILFFPVYTRLGTKWITSKRILKENDLLKEEFEEKEVVFVSKEEKDTSNHINLGWLNLPYEKKNIKIDLSKLKSKINQNDIIIVPDSLISQIINSNLEVRTSVSIDPITGVAKDGALFTSEAIPRGTIFCGEVRAFAREGGNSLPELGDIWSALNDSKQYYQSLGVGGMTTRGFGRMEILGELS